MPLDFPASPTNGQTYGNYIYDSSITAWRNVNSETGISALNAVGLKNIVPTSVSVGSGSATVNANGLVTFTGVLSVSLNNVFSANHRNYRMVIESPTNVGANAVIGVRYRTGTTDNSTNVYFQYQAFNRLNGTFSTNSGGPNTFYSLANVGAQTNSFTSWSGDIMMPYVSTGQTVSNGLGMAGDTTSSYQVISSVLFNATTSFDGITIMTNTSTSITGTIQIFGYTS